MSKISQWIIVLHKRNLLNSGWVPQNRQSDRVWKLRAHQQQYVLQLETSKQTADIAKGIGVGLYDVGEEYVKGVWNFVTNPGESIEIVANSIIHPIKP